MIRVKLKRLHEQAIHPSRGTPMSLGLDLHAIALTEDGRPSKILIPPKTTRNIATGWAILPWQPAKVTQDYANLETWLHAVCSRSGLASKSIFVANAPGIIDPDYRGEIKILLYNGGVESYYVQHGDRVAQLVSIKATLSDVELVSDVGDSKRGAAGFGSTGQ